jgi:hypothetical protein
VPSLPVPDAIWAPIVKLVINHLLQGVVKESERRARTADPRDRTPPPAPSPRSRLRSAGHPGLGFGEPSLERLGAPAVDLRN